MSMAKALICDNCKKCFYYSSDLNVINNVVFGHSGINGQRLISNYDICPECVKKIFEALPGLMKKEGHDEN